jgi:hypothetical protein
MKCLGTMRISREHRSRRAPSNTDAVPAASRIRSTACTAQATACARASMAEASMSSSTPRPASSAASMSRATAYKERSPRAQGSFGLAHAQLSRVLLIERGA